MGGRKVGPDENVKQTIATAEGDIFFAKIRGNCDQDS